MTSLPADTEGTAYSQTVTMTGGAGTATFSISAGSLPAGLTLSSTGTISGTPTGPNQTSNFTVKVTDASTVAPQSATQALSITINLPTPPSITTTSLPAGVEGTGYNQTIATTGGLAPLTFSTTTGSLPPGLTLSGAGAITGTPSGPNGTSNFTVKVTDSSNPVQTATQALSIQINLPAPPVISPTTLPGGNQGTPYSQTLTGSSGLAPYSWTVSSGALPAGLGLTTSSGTTATISGTPTTQQSNVAFTIQVTDSSNPSQHGTQAYTVTIGAPLPLSVTTTSSQLPGGTENVAYTATNLTATGGIAPYTWSVVSPGTGALPTGMSLSSAGQLSGTPTVSGTFPFTAQVTDSTNATATANLSITITAPSAGCGSGSESNMKGQYAFSLIGYNSIGFLGAVGSFTADGSGNITAGTIDANGSGTGGLGYQTGSVTANGSFYSLGSDNRGCATIVTPFYTFTTHFSFDSATPPTIGTIQEWESGSTPYIASGQIFKQNFPTTVPNGVWVYSQTGVYSAQGTGTEDRLTVAGTKTVSSGTITAGEYDSNVQGVVVNSTGITGTETTPNSTTGRFTAATTLDNVTLNRVVYLISNTQEIEITSDPMSTTDEILVGYVQLQSGALTLSGYLVYYGSGMEISGAGSFVQIARIKVANSGYTGSVYEDDAGTWATPTPSTPTCTYAIDSYGRVATSGASCGTFYASSTWSYPPVFYLTGTNTGFLLGTDPGSLLGQIAPQSATSLTTNTYYLGIQEVVNQGVQTATGFIQTNPSGAINGTVDETSIGSPEQANQILTDTLTVNSDGTFTSAQNGGKVYGIILSDSQAVTVNKQGHSYPTIMVISTGPAS
ncbi:MAG TPA: putative Ig domain-containing protein [Candidatus Sulfotelmatobacter sp.]|nr:putative Ig domain-containing protein [Candidatus Sulfotelmatobacter sp.]